MDGRTHGATTLAYPGLASFQGPALLVYHDTVLSDADFRSISRVAQAAGRERAGDAIGYAPGGRAAALPLPCGGWVGQTHPRVSAVPTGG